MKLNRYTLIVMFITSLLGGCEEYLDKSPDAEGLSQDDIFTDIRQARSFLDGAYANLVTEVSAKGQWSDPLSAMVMSGEGLSGRLNNGTVTNYDTYKVGDYLSLMNLTPNRNWKSVPKFVTRYTEAWRAIRITNTFLENVSLLANEDQTIVDRLTGEAYLLRAFQYHLLTKRHGGLVYIKDNFDLNSNLDRERDSYQNNVDNMLEDLDLAFNLLPIQWPSEDMGRPTKGLALALKSRISLFAASQLANPSNDNSLWERAATAAGEMINYANSNNLYQLVDASEAINLEVDNLNGADLYVGEPDKLLNYRSMFIGPGLQKIIPQEVIFMELNETAFASGGLVPKPRMWLTTGFNAVRGNNNPQNVGALHKIVKKFETKQGLSIEDDPNYNPQNPFINRDPRFYNAILFDGVNHFIDPGYRPNNGITDLAFTNEDGVRGMDRVPDVTAQNNQWRVLNNTGYRIRKWHPNGFTHHPTFRNHNFYVNNIVFRMAEIYLNYAEAVNEAYGVNGSASNSSLTALDAINIIRSRVGMPNVLSRYTGSSDAFRERIRNERTVELCFEGHHYEDIRRWKTASNEENTNVEILNMVWQGVSPEYPTGFIFNIFNDTDRKKTFTERNYWWPVPNTEVEAAPLFGQTEGW